MALATGATPASGDEGGEWVELAPMAQARQETGAARIGDRVYVVGALVGFGFARDSVEVYDIAADRWSFAAPLPEPRDHMGVAALDGKLWVSGGYTGSFDARSTLFVYDPATDSWSERAPMPEPRGAHWMVAHGGKLYVFGGVDASDRVRTATLIYDPTTDSWSEGADLPTPREHLNAVAAGDFIYVLGGRSGAPSDRNERYHPATDTWTSLTPMPTARSAGAVAALDGRIHYMGGEIPRLFAVHEVYDIATDTWSCAAPMPLPRHGVAAVSLDDRILLPGGGTIQGLAPTRRVDAFIPEVAPSGPADRLRFRLTGFRAEEGAGAARISVLRQGDGRGEVAVTARTVDGDPGTTATPGADYLPVAVELRWADGDTARKTFSVPLLDDTETEGDETIRLRLSEPVGAELGEPSEAVLTLEDDDLDGPGRLTLAAESFVAFEGSAGGGEGSVTVEVLRTGGTLGTVRVSYAVEDLSATAGEDYLAVGGTLQWADGEGGAKSFSVPLLDDADPERTELARVVLTEATGGAALERATAAAVIRDDDPAGGPGSAGCTEGPEHLCLVDGRFRVEAEWRDPRSGDSGLGRTILESGTTGFFWFFSPTNVELIVKMLDGRSITGAFWVFYGALSDVEYWISVTDTEPAAGDGATDFRLFHNEPFELASFADTSAFPQPPSGDAVHAPQARAHTAASAGRLRPVPATHENEEGPGPTAPCEVDAETLCLGPDGRFRVTVTWAEPGGDTGTGRAEVRSEETGTFWFFSPDNLELVVKLLDARVLNGHFWFFSGALSNVEYTITVTDTETGATREYPNPQGTLQSRADTEAFDG